MFEASDSFAFFDYFRVPYQVRPPHLENGHAGAAQFVRAVSTKARPGQDRRSLLWVSGEARPAAQSEAGRLGRYRLGGFTFFAYVVPDTLAPAMLPRSGQNWHPAESVHDADGAQVASIWRDANGNVFLPFDPGEVMRLFWSEGYRDVGRSAVAASCRAVAMRGGSTFHQRVDSDGLFLSVNERREESEQEKRPCRHLL